MSWQPTPPSDLLIIERFCAGEWHRVDFDKLRRGDIWRAFLQTGERVEREEEGEDIVAICTDDPVRNPIGVGWWCEVEYVPFASIRARAN